VPATNHRNRTVLCADCGLIFSTPRPSNPELDAIYDDEFAGDPGANALTFEAGIPQRKLVDEERAARQLCLPLLCRFMDPAGKEILVIRGRTGALAQAIAEAGAKVCFVDPFPMNNRYAREVRGLEDCHEVPLTRFGSMLEGAEGRFDCVCALTIHVLAHVPSPRDFLARAHALLKPDGLLLIEEKDVLQPAYAGGLSIFDTGVAHLYHLTLPAARSYLEQAGFEIEHAAYDGDRRTSSQHFVMAARKRPEAQAPALPGPRPERAQAIARRVRYLELLQPPRAMVMRARRSYLARRKGLKRTLARALGQ
jgi:SAM-dependent methyltransferase